MSMLRMTKQADYGVVLMTHLARHPGSRFAASELAEESGIPLPTVSKILKILTREGLIDSHRGVKGGYSLVRDPEAVSVAQMIAALDGPIAFTECIEDTPGVCSQEATCGVRSNWQLINRVVRNALENISLAQLAMPLPPKLVQLGGGGSAVAN